MGENRKIIESRPELGLCLDQPHVYRINSRLQRILKSKGNTMGQFKKNGIWIFMAVVVVLFGAGSVQSNQRNSSWDDKAILLEKNNDWKGMESHALSWTKAEPKNSIAWDYLGMAYWATKQYNKAIESYLQAISIKPDNSFAWSNLGVAYTDTKQYAKGIEACLQSIHIKADHPRAWYNLGNVYWATNKQTKAIESYQQAVHIKPDYAKAWFNLGNAYRGTAQYAKAIEADQQAVHIKADYAKAWFNLGVDYKMSGQADKVMEVHKRLKALDPGIADMFFSKVVTP
jgi:tetratricopeptide (TPR) repeat protein